MGFQLIDGVTVIEAFYCTVWASPWIVLLAAGLACCLIGVIMYYEDVDNSFVAFSLSGLFIFFFCVAAAVYTPYNKYEVLVSESVNYQELNSKYDILEQNGVMLLIREKNEPITITYKNEKEVEK